MIRLHPPEYLPDPDDTLALVNRIPCVGNTVTLTYGVDPLTEAVIKMSFDDGTINRSLLLKPPDEPAFMRPIVAAPGTSEQVVWVMSQADADEVRRDSLSGTDIDKLREYFDRLNVNDVWGPKLEPGDAVYWLEPDPNNSNEQDNDARKFFLGSRFIVVERHSAGKYRLASPFVGRFDIQRNQPFPRFIPVKLADTILGRNTVASETAPANTAEVSAEGQSMATKKSVEEVGVVRHGKEVIIPEGVSFDDAIKLVTRQRDFENEVVRVVEDVNAFPWDGAVALQKALKQTYGWAETAGLETMFGKIPPSVIPIEVAPGVTVDVPWGRFPIRQVEGEFRTGVSDKEGRMIFQFSTEVKRKYEKEVKAIGALTRKIAKEDSIYKGRAVRVTFPDEGPMAALSMLDVRNATEDRLVFTKRVSDVVGTCLFEPIESYELLKRFKVPFKRGVALVGTFGTGKTELAFTAGHKATLAGITFFYCADAQHFKKTLQLAMQYAPAVVFVEDIDRVTSGDRTSALDDVLNTIDGLEAKASEIMVVVTSNNIAQVNKAMLRPGRLDAVIEIDRPDTEAIGGLIKLYARNLLPEGEDIAAASKLLAGNIPAVVREVVERAKLSAIRLSRLSGEPVSKVTLSGEALRIAAESMKMQLDLLDREETPTPTDLQLFGQAVGNAIGDGMTLFAEAVKEDSDLRQHLDGECEPIDAAESLSGSAHTLRRSVRGLARTRA